MMTLDLHGLFLREAFAKFITTYNLHPGCELKIIHGYGASGKGGVIKKALRNYLEKHKDSFGTIRYGEVISGNYGFTVVRYKQKLPPVFSELKDKIIEFCTDNAKSGEKIIGKYRNEGSPIVMQALKELKNDGLLIEVKGKIKKYVIVK